MARLLKLLILQTTIDCVAWTHFNVRVNGECMTPETIDHRTLARLVETGHIGSAHIVGCAEGWAVQVKRDSIQHSLTAQRSHRVRLFKKLETLVAYLKSIGIHHFDVDASSYDPMAVKTYSRPDRAEALKQAHDAAAYERWFKEQVMASINDPQPSVSDEQARRLFAAKREALRQRTR